MRDKLEKLREAALGELNGAASAEEVQAVRTRYLGRKGLLTEVLRNLKDVPLEERPLLGGVSNTIKEELSERIGSRLLDIEQSAREKALIGERVDVTLPGRGIPYGRLHPLTRTLDEICSIFLSLGFDIAEGPDVETDYYNFEALNMPKDHPARDMQDTFYINTEWLLRTHTTAIQTRMLEDYAGATPVKVICPGKVYRKDDDDATHSHQFTQMEGLVVGYNISMADLKGTLEGLAKAMFGESRVIRFRPSYFQFTEPSVEVDVSCHICNGKGCSTCKGTGWIEILGAGMVHPNVLTMAGFDAEKVSGFAFGLGVERVAMLKYGIDDIRHFYTNDLRFLSAFKRFE